MTIELLRDKINSVYRNDKHIVYLFAAGFEERNVATIDIFTSKNFKFKNAVALEYPDKDLNEPVSKEMIETVVNLSEDLKKINIDEEPISKICDLFNPIKSKVLVDITGMSRVLIFQILHLLENNDIEYDIIYTEAEEYFPMEAFYNRLFRDNASKERAFTNYLLEERSPIVYSYDCDIPKNDEFAGYPEPGRPAMLIAFLAYKRSRLQIILQNFEFEKKKYLLSEPIRNDLKWRRDYLEIANYDLLEKGQTDIYPIETLFPLKSQDILEDIVYRDGNYSKYNIFLAPLGSKMQTVGSYLFWRSHPEISVIFSQPKQFFKDTYSKGYRDTFVFPYDEIKPI